jgi:hypothetical protein
MTGGEKRRGGEAVIGRINPCNSVVKILVSFFLPFYFYLFTFVFYNLVI